MSFLKPVRKPHDRKGRCEACGKDLGASAWIFGESTGCSKKCAIEAEDADSREWADEWDEERSETSATSKSLLQKGVDYIDRFGDES